MSPSILDRVRSRGACLVVLIVLGAWSCPARAIPPVACPGDANADGVVNFGDVTGVLVNFGGPGPAGDATGDCLVNFGDVTSVLVNFGATCPDPWLWEPGLTHCPPSMPEAVCGALDIFTPYSFMYPATGEVTLSISDLAISGRGFDFSWARTYRSRAGGAAGTPANDTAQGAGWDYSYNLYVERCGPDLYLHDGRARADRYVLQPGGTWQSPEFFRELRQNPDQSYTLTFENLAVWNFHRLDGLPAEGRIASIVDRNGNTMTFDYDGAGRLVAIHDTLDDAGSPRVIVVAYTPDDRIASVSDWTGRTVTYTYYGAADPDGALGDLRTATTPPVINNPDYPIPPGHDFPTGKTTTYTYSRGFADQRLDHNLLTVRDALGQVFMTCTYSPLLDASLLGFDRVERVVLGDPGDIIDFVYLAQTPAPANNGARIRTIMNDRVGNVGEVFYDGRNRLVMHLAFTGRAPDPDNPTTDVVNRPVAPLRPTDPPYFETRWEYNGDGKITRIIRPNLNEELRTYDTANADRRAQGNLLQRCRLPGPLGGAQPALCDSYTYVAGLGSCCGTSFVQSHTDPSGGVEAHSYDAQGNRTHTTHRIPSIVDDWTYNTHGQLTSHLLPDNGSGHRRRDEFTHYGPADGYENGHRRAMIIDAAGFALTTTYEHNRIGNVVREVDPRGNDTLRIYDQLGLLVREQGRAVTLPLGSMRASHEHFYDANNNLLQTDILLFDDQGAPAADPVLTTTHGYEILNRRISTTAEVTPFTTLTTELEYDANRNQTLVRFGQAVSGADPFNTVARAYDERGLLYREVRAPGSAPQSSSQWDYDGNGNTAVHHAGLEAVTPRLTTSVHDGYDRRVGLTDAMGNAVTLAYDSNGNLIEERVEGEHIDVPGGAGNVRLKQVFFAYDAEDRRVCTDQAFFDALTQAPISDGSSMSCWTYSDNSQVLSETDDLAHSTTTAYDTANRPLAVIDAAGHSLMLGYDANGNLVQQVETEQSDLGLGTDVYTTQHSYDEENRRVASLDNAGSVASQSFDSRSLVTERIDRRGNAVRTTYDGVGRPVSETRDLHADGTGGSALIGAVQTAYTWDDSSRLRSRTDDNGNTTTYAFDALDRLFSTQYADGTVAQKSFDVFDNPVTEVLPWDPIVNNSFDAAGRLIARSIATGPLIGGTTAEFYSHDGLGRVRTAQDDDSLFQRDYDSLSSVVRETQQQLPGGPVALVQCSHDGVGNELLCQYPGGRQIQRAYDALDRVISIQDPAIPAPVALSWYRGPSRLERRDYANGTRAEAAFDVLGRPSLVSHLRIAGAVLFEQRAYQWDASSNRVFESDTLAVPQPSARLHAHDSLDRLRSTQFIAPAPPPPWFYLLDGVGNRTALNGPQPPPAGDGGAYAMSAAMPAPADRQMNQYTQTAFDARVYDAGGSLIQSGVPARLYQYDYRRQLIRFHDTATGVTTTHKYDCIGRRIERAVGAAVSRYCYDDHQEIEQQTAAGATVMTTVWGGGLDDVISTALAGQHRFYHTDDLGSVLSVTNQAGNVLEKYRYEDFGRPTFLNPGGGVIAATAIGNPHLFTARRYDPESGFSWFRTRYLDHRAGRFTTRDTIGEWADALAIGNSFTYVGNNPLAWTDPMGTEGDEKCCCCCVDDATLKNVQKINEAGMYGHDFDIEVKLTYIKTETEMAGDCNLKWMEKTNDPPAWQGIEPNTWTDIYKKFRTSATFLGWEPRKKGTQVGRKMPCPDSETTNIHDGPATSLRRADRTLDFSVTLESAPNCPCAVKSITLNFQQVLESTRKDGGNKPRVKTQTLLPTKPPKEVVKNE